MKLALDAPGKVNLCLFLGPLREDGRHELVTVIESVSLADHLAITTRPDGEDRVRCAGVDEPNLVTLALEKLRAHDWGGPPLTVEIDKRLPVAGGMGGGSADAAALLRAARHLSPLPDHTVGQIAAELGADVPSQLEPGLTLATGAGEQVQALAPLPEHAFVIIPATTKLSTAAVYSEADRLGLPRDTAELASIDPLERLGVNDLQPATLSLCPEVGRRPASSRRHAGLWFGSDGLRPPLGPRRTRARAPHRGRTTPPVPRDGRRPARRERRRRSPPARLSRPAPQPSAPAGREPWPR